MPSLYIPSTQTIILGYGHRYTHPTTGEVYGGTDYDNNDKLCEIGAVPLRMVGPQPGMVANGWEIVLDETGPGYVRRPTIESPIPPPVIDPELLAFRREYLDTTAALCQLAGEPYTGKLENTDYARVVMKASTNPVAGVLTATLVYCRTVLRELDGQEWFENIVGV